MKIAIIGAGFTGLTAALRLSQKGHAVDVFEKDGHPGGLAIGIQLPSFNWSIEKHYHHLFTNDITILRLLKELHINTYTPPSLTSLYYKNHIYPFNSPSHILAFPLLPLIDRLRLAAVSSFLKILPQKYALNLEKSSASAWIKKWYGEETYRIIWEPLLSGKFNEYKDTVNAAWFWGRIKKRTFSLIYIERGFQSIAKALEQKIISSDGSFHYKTLFHKDQVRQFDQVIVTTPTTAFLKMFPDLPRNYTRNLKHIPHLHALNLLLITKEKFLSDNTYWLNINDRKFPFIAVVEHTNFIDPKYYGGNHIIYVGNYLPSDHPYLKMSKEELFKLYLPYLKKINPHFNFTLYTLRFELFFGPFAQPVFPVNYSQHIPPFQTPIKNVYLANMDMVYPWDRGTNYAVEIGEKIADLVDQNKRY